MAKFKSCLRVVDAEAEADDWRTNRPTRLADGP